MTQCPVCNRESDRLGDLCSECQVVAVCHCIECTMKRNLGGALADKVDREIMEAAA